MAPVSLPPDPTVVYILVGLFAGAVVLGLIFVWLGRVPSVPEPEPETVRRPFPAGDAPAPGTALADDASRAPWSTGEPNAAPPMDAAARRSTLGPRADASRPRLGA